jgi:hypothetical protein
VRRRALERSDGHPEAAFALGLPYFEVGAVEVDERELGRHEEPGAHREEQADDEQNPLRHGFYRC